MVLSNQKTITWYNFNHSIYSLYMAQNDEVKLKLFISYKNVKDRNISNISLKFCKLKNIV